MLAYSTISQLGFMFLALGVRAYAAAIFLVVAHAFYKATLFLGAGSVIHGSADNQDMRTMGGLRKYMPFTALGFIVAWLAIAGVPPFAGFWAKDEVLSRAYFAGDYGVWIVGVVAAAMTAFYMTRAVWLVFFGNERFQAAEPAAEAEEHGFSLESPTVPAYVPPKPARLTHPPHESPPTMTLPDPRPGGVGRRRRSAQPAVPWARVPRRLARAHVRARARDRCHLVRGGRDLVGDLGDRRARRVGDRAVPVSGGDPVTRR